MSFSYNHGLRLSGNSVQLFEGIKVLEITFKDNAKVHPGLFPNNEWKYLLRVHS